MKILRIQDIDLRWKRVFAKFDFNVPFDKNKDISDYTRLKGALHTIEYLLDQNCSIVMASHLGKPRWSWYQKQFSLEPVQRVLRAMLRWDVKMADWVCNSETIKIAKDLKSREILLLENLRFDDREVKNDEGFAGQLSSMADVYINDGFWVIHRQHASIDRITDFFPSDKKGLGFLVQKEISYLREVVDSPDRPFVAIVGWSKISSKLLAVKQLVGRVDKIIIGGAMAFTFLKAKGYEVWRSLVEDYLLNDAREIIKTMEEQGKELVLPVDFVVSKVFGRDWDMKTVGYNEIPRDFMGLDIWVGSVNLFREKCIGAKTIFWNWPMGAYELEEFFNGSASVASILAESGGVTIVWGGDSISIINGLWLADRFSFISTWWGASLKLLEGKSLIGIEKLRKKKKKNFWQMGIK